MECGDPAPLLSSEPASVNHGRFLLYYNGLETRLEAIRSNCEPNSKRLCVGGFDL